MNGSHTSPLFHALVHVDHHCAHIVQFGSDQVRMHKVKEQLHLHSAHEKNERARHAFFAKVCDDLQGIAQVLVVGGHTSLADFRNYVEKHRPHAHAQLAGYQVIDHPSQNELLALARTWFSQRELMADVDV